MYSKCNMPQGCLIHIQLSFRVKPKYIYIYGSRSSKVIDTPSGMVFFPLQRLETLRNLTQPEMVCSLASNRPILLLKITIHCRNPLVRKSTMFGESHRRMFTSWIPSPIFPQQTQQPTFLLPRPQPSRRCDRRHCRRNANR